MKFIKCVLWFVKEYANVGIAVALFLLIGLQIEKQYRSTRYFDNCINQDWTVPAAKNFHIKNKKEDLDKIVAICTNIRKKAKVPFNHFKGRTYKYLKDYDF